MASATGLARNDEADLALTWSGRWTLTHRILAVNILTLAIFALSILYLDAYRNRITIERTDRLASETAIAAEALNRTAPGDRGKALTEFGIPNQSRLRLYAPDGRKTADSWASGQPTYRLRDPAQEKWKKDVARALDRGFNALVGEAPPPDFLEPDTDRAQAWSLLRAVGAEPAVEIRNAPDLTPVFVGAARLADGSRLLVTKNDRNLTRTVRSQRATLGFALALAAILSILLSLFLARTIVRPLRRIAEAAHRVRHLHRGRRERAAGSVLGRDAQHERRIPGRRLRARQRARGRRRRRGRVRHACCGRDDLDRRRGRRGRSAHRVDQRDGGRVQLDAAAGRREERQHGGRGSDGARQHEPTHGVRPVAPRER